MKLKSSNLSASEIKKIVKVITEEVKKEENLPHELIKVHPVTIIEYYMDEETRKRLKDVNLQEKLGMLLDPITSKGINYFNDGDIYVFITPNTIIKKISKDNPHQLLDILITTYHEIGHSYQIVKPDNYSYFEKTIIIHIENYIRNKHDRHYQEHHDDYLGEIDAELFGINKAEKFLKQNNMYKPEEKIIKRMKAEIEFSKHNFNFDEIWNEFYKTYNFEIQNKNYRKARNKDQLNALIDIFFKENTSKFRSISEICNHKNSNILDKEIFSRILTSPCFLKQLDYKKLTRGEINILFKVIEYILEEEKKKKQYNKGKSKEVNESIVKIANLRIDKKVQELKKLIYELKLKDAELTIESSQIRR